ncbi:MAG: FAD binding domain-containing protein, partial [Candidatus Auribacterota bacterium]|nr:FAD binding domain-containing protein [Candidatus Auribacterota bacterium]
MKLTELQRVSYPETVAEAVAILSDEKRRAVPVAGGITFAFSPPENVEEMVGLRRLPLNYIKKKGGAIHVGATTPISDLVSSRVIKGYADGMILETVRRIGSTLNRNLITVGGNLVQPFIWSDLSTVALALGARIIIQDENKRRELSAEEFFARVPAKSLKPGSLVTEIIFPPFAKNARAAYEKFTLTEFDYAILKVAIVLTRTGK